MNRSFVLLLLFAGSSHLFAGGGGEEAQSGGSRRDREQPRLEEARANPVDDITGYTVRTAAHWPGPQRGIPSANYYLDAWEEIAAQYDLEREWIQMPNPETLMERMTATVLLGEPFADIIWIDGSRLPVLAENNLILPLDEYIDFDDPRMFDQTYPITTYKGRHYGFVPYVISPGGGLWYNRTLLQREGLPDPMDLQEQDEWTWDVFFDMAQQTTRDTDGDGEFDQFGITIGYEIEPGIIQSNGASAVREVAPGTYEFSLDTPEALEALQFIARLYESNVLSYESEAMFIAGRAAFYWGQLFQGNNMLLNMEDEYGFIYMARGPSTDRYHTVAGAGAMIAFPANVNFPPELLGEIVTRTAPFPIIEDVQMEFVSAQVQTQRDLDKVFEMIEATEFRVTASTFPGLSREIGRVYRDIRNGVSPATAVATYRQSAQAAIDATIR